MGTVLRPGVVVLLAVEIGCAEGAGEVQDGEFAQCFRSSHDFVCYGINDRCTPDSPGFRDGAPPALRLSADPFLSFLDESAADQDHDLLRDTAELELAAAIAPYAVNAWAAHRFWEDPDLGGPVGLFQVRPLVDGGAEVLRPDRRAIRVRFVLLWDTDDGYLTGDRCSLGDGYTQHEGDNQTYTFVLEMAGGGTPAADPRLWRVRDPAAGAAWWYQPEAVRGAREVRELHPVLFFSRGKHHNSQVTCDGCALARCTEDLFCPTAADFGTRQPADRLVDAWHDFVGRHVVAVDGSARFAVLGRRFGFPGPGRRLGNNVGEPEAHLLDALDDLCVWNSATWPEDPGAPWEAHCFTDERAWDDREFWGGRCPGCDESERARDAWHGTSRMGELWEDEELSDADGDGLRGIDDPCPVQVEGSVGPWPVAVDGDRDGLADVCDEDLAGAFLRTPVIPDSLAGSAAPAPGQSRPNSPRFSGSPTGPWA